MRIHGSILLVAAILLATAYLLASTAGWLSGYSLVALKSSGIALLAIFAARRQAWLLALALMFSSIGDAMLALEPSRLVLGMASFGAAHVFYAYLFARIWRQGGTRSTGWLGVGLIALYGAGMLYWLLPGMGELTIPASGYLLIIMIMAALALISRASLIALAGAILFVLSDSLIAVDLFLDLNPVWRGPAVWITYVAAQICLTLGLVKERP